MDGGASREALILLEWSHRRRRKRRRRIRRRRIRRRRRRSFTEL
jgi:hypothetical protein